MQYNSIYVYSIVEGKINKKFKVHGIGKREDNIYCVNFKDITAIISLTPFQEYDPTEENILNHEHVIQELVQEGNTLIPMRFCTLLKSRQDLSKLLNSGYLSFKKNLIKIKDKNEYGVKLFLKIDKLKSSVKTNNELYKKSSKIASDFYDLLKKVTFDNVLEEQITNEMIMNGSFLVKRNSTNKFLETINKFDKLYTDIIKIRIAGPTAPYNFVKMPLRW